MQHHPNRKVALITGSTSGIGKSTAEKFSREGYHVIVTGRNSDRGQAVRRGILENNGSADFFAADLTQQHEAEALAEHAASRGKLTVLVNCAGGNKPGMSLDDHIATNYKAVRFITNAALVFMAAGSSIVTVTSICSESKRAHEGGPYSDAKAGATSYVHGTIKDLALRRIRTNIIAPGLTNTPDIAHIPSEDRKVLIERMPLSADFLDPEEVAQVIYDVTTWKHVTGQTIIIDGGMTALSD